MNKYFSSKPNSPLKNLFLILSLFLLTRNVISIDPRFLACNAKSCGDDQIISFPFHIEGQQEPYCGYPGFNITCKNNRPIIRLNDEDYRIHNISYQNQTIRISKSENFDSRMSCILPFKTTILPEDRFRLLPNQTWVYFFNECNETRVDENELAKYKLNCSISGNESISSVLSIFEGDSEQGFASEVCKHEVKVPVNVDKDVKKDEVEIEKMVENGFLLNWIASNCSLCEESGGKCGFNVTTWHFKCFCTDRPHSSDCDPEKKTPGLKLGLGLGLGTGVPALLLLFYVILRCYKKRKSASNFLSSNSFSHPSSRSDVEGGSVYYGVPLFSYTELEEATSNFDTRKELGDGGFGTVYYGKLKDGREVAVKRLYEHNYKRVEQFMNEVEILRQLRHKNLVTLYGCTSRRSRELLLVYEYIPNGTVADHLHGDRAKTSPLTWSVRMSIAVETASALAYLHASDTIHRDVKSTNILLDSNFCVKVADFGLSRLFPNNVTHVSTAPQGTPGYVDPEYHLCYQLTDKSDVYSFGVVLIELISSMPAVDISRHRHEINLAHLAQNKIQNGDFDELIDPSIGYKSDKEVTRMTILVAELAFRCLQQDKELRPSMDEVLEELNRIKNWEHEHYAEEVQNDDNQASTNMMPPASPPYCIEASLLKNMRIPPSPDTVTAQWPSSCSTASIVSS